MSAQEGANQMHGDHHQKEDDTFRPYTVPGDSPITELVAKVPKLALAAAIFFTTTPIPSPDGMRGPHNG